MFNLLTSFKNFQCTPYYLVDVVSPEELAQERKYAYSFSYA